MNRATERNLLIRAKGELISETIAVILTFLLRHGDRVEDILKVDVDMLDVFGVNLHVEALRKLLMNVFKSHPLRTRNLAKVFFSAQTFNCKIFTTLAHGWIGDCRGERMLLQRVELFRLQSKL